MTHDPFARQDDLAEKISPLMDVLEGEERQALIEDLTSLDWDVLGAHEIEIIRQRWEPKLGLE